MTPELIGAFLGGGGLAGLLAVFRARSQNRLDEGTARQAEASAELTIVQTARELIEGVRAEMGVLRKDTDEKVGALRDEVAYLRGQLDAARTERDALREVEANLRTENAQLRDRIEKLETRISALTDELAKAATSSPTSTVEVKVDSGLPGIPGGRRSTDPV